jgi:uroporphyrinogen-III synthase
LSSFTDSSAARPRAVALVTSVCLALSLLLPCAPALAGAHKTIDRALIGRDEMPLYGKTILYTTPRNYAGRLGRYLIEHGARAIWMPTIVIEPMPDYSVFDDVLLNAEKYDWIAFTSRNGIEALLDRMGALGLAQADLKGLRFAAVGNDAKALEQAGITPDIVPPVSSPIGIVNELKRQGYTSGTVLVPAPEVVGMEEPEVVPDFIRDLEAIGLDTVKVPAYVTARATDGLELGTQLLLDGKVDVIAFTSRGEMESLLLHLGDKRDVLDGDTAIACFGPITAGGAKLRNLRVDIVADDYSRFQGFVSAMEDYFDEP